jgi:hypothetical protein
LLTVRAGIAGEWFPEARGDRYKLSAHMQTGRAFGNTPLDEMFMLGMERDTDQSLWLRGIAAARDGRKGTAPIGREYAMSQTTLHMKLFEIPFLRVNAGPFVDAGWVGDPTRRFGSNGPIYDTGMQAELRTIGGLTLTAVYGRDLSSGGGAFYTSVGYEHAAR